MVWDVVLDLDVVLVEGAVLDFLVVGGGGSSAGGLVGQLPKKTLSFG